MGRISCRLKSAERSMLTEEDGFGVDSARFGINKGRQLRSRLEREKSPKLRGDKRDRLYDRPRDGEASIRYLRASAFAVVTSEKSHERERQERRENGDDMFSSPFTRLSVSAT
ncbi:hypothetical protein Bca4012_014401 [Brassica carinata]